MNTTKIYLIRHAEAEGNLYRRSQGCYNSNVTTLGRRQIAALAGRFREVHLDALVTSDLYRTQSTALAITRFHPTLSPRLEPRLREIDVGIWEDRPWGDLEADYPEQMEYFSNDPLRWSVPGGEPYAHVRARMLEVLGELCRRYPGGTVAAVSHGLAIRSLVTHFLGLPSREISTIPYGDNTSVALVTGREDALELQWYNDASHLDAAGLSTTARQSWWRNGQGRAPAKRVYSRFVPLDMRTEAELYTRVYADTWRASHGDLRGFVPEVYLGSARAHAEADPRCLMKLYTRGELTGLVELDPERGAEDGAGWICLLFIEPDCRGLRLGAQLVGHAVSFFRRKGRRCLRLHVAESNPAAIGFYTALGFTQCGTAPGALGPLKCMEFDIRQRVLTPEDIWGDFRTEPAPPDF